MINNVKDNICFWYGMSYFVWCFNFWGFVDCFNLNLYWVDSFVFCVFGLGYVF